VGISAKPFLCAFFGEKYDLGTFWAHEILNVDFGLRETNGCNIKNEDAVQHPRFPLCITFAVFARGL